MFLYHETFVCLGKTANNMTNEEHQKSDNSERNESVEKLQELAKEVVNKSFEYFIAITSLSFEILNVNKVIEKPRSAATAALAWKM